MAATFPLTTGADTIPSLIGSKGTSDNSGDDTINASLVYAAGGVTVDPTSTLSVADQLNGGTGNDVMNVTVTGGNAGLTFAAANILGVETLNLRNVSGQTLSLDASTVAGLTTINADRATSTVTLTNVASGAAGGMIGDGTAANGAFNLGYVGTATAATLNISGGTTGGAPTITGAALTSTTINSTGAANTVGAIVDANTSRALTINATTALTTGTIGDSAARTAITINATGNVTTGAVTSSAATTVAITGAGNVTTNLNAVVAPTITVAGSGAVSLGTLNAASTTLTSTQTGGSLTVTANAVATSKITGGAGNDVITSGGVALTTGFVDGGAGNDTLVLGNVTDVNTAALGAKYTNFETLRFNGTVDASLVSGITAIQLSGATNTVTNMTATQAAAVQARADIGATTLALANAAGTSDVLTLTMGLGTTTNPATNSGAGGLTVTGFETLNIIANPGPTVATAANMLTTIAALTGATLNRVNMSGSAVAITNGATTVATTFDASALTGDSNATIGTAAASIKGLTLGGSLVAGSTVIGSNFVDTITMGAGGSTYNTGAGNDVVSATQAVWAAATAVNGGEGTRDVQRISDTAVTTATLTVDDNAFKVATGFESVDFSGAVAGDFIWNLAGYANAIATANGGVITATATALVPTATADVITVDASGLAGTNALNLTLTTTSGVAAANTGATNITGSAGADTIVFTEGTAAAANLQRPVTISTGNGNDTIRVTTATTGAVVIDAGAGNDTITGSAVSDAITGGTGSDTMTGNGAIDTFIFAANGSVIGTALDIITDMGTTDILQFGTGTLVLLPADATALVAGTNVQQSAGGLVTFAAADNTLALKIAAIQADTQLDAAQSVAFFVDSGNTYVYYAGAAIGNADDQLVQLSGVTALTTITVGGGGNNNMVIA